MGKWFGLMVAHNLSKGVLQKCCDWKKQEDGTWKTECGYTDKVLREECPYCGKKVWLAKMKMEEEAELSQ